MSKKRKTRKENIFLITVTTMVTIFGWIALSVYMTINKSTVPEVLQQQLKPIEPNIDEKVLQSLKKRGSFSQTDLDSVPEITKFSLPEEETSEEQSSSGREASSEGKLNNEN